MSTLRKAITVATGGLAISAGWVGFKIPPGPVPALVSGPDLGSVELPPDLPPPVRTYFRRTIGERVPKVETAVLWGTFRMNLGTWLTGRFRAYHAAGRHFRRIMEITWFGQPVFRVKDEYVNGKGATVFPWGRLEGEQMDQGANIVLWLEGLGLPSLLVTHPRVRWEAVDESSARLIFPLGEGEDEVTLRFDPVTGLIKHVWAMRYRGPEGPKEPWRTDYLQWRLFPDGLFASEIAITWEEQGRPWSYWQIASMAWNVDVSAHLPA